MREQPNRLVDNRFSEFASTRKAIRIHVPEFEFKHDNDIRNGKKHNNKDKFVGREVQSRRLFTWLTSDSRSGSYLVTGYRGMGKSMLVDRTIERISLETKQSREFLYYVTTVLMTIAQFCIFIFIGKAWSGTRTLVAILLSMASLGVALYLWYAREKHRYDFDREVKKVHRWRLFDKELLSKFFIKGKDLRFKDAQYLHVKINLGQEVLHERDVLSLLTNELRNKYYAFLHNRQQKPFRMWLLYSLTCTLACVFAEYFICPQINTIVDHLAPEKTGFFKAVASTLNDIQAGKFYIFYKVVVYLFTLWLTNTLVNWIIKHLPWLSIPLNSIKKLDELRERIGASVGEYGSTPTGKVGTETVNVSFFGRGKVKMAPQASVREIEQELLDIVNQIDGEDCPKPWRAQFIVVFDELDKVTNTATKRLNETPDAPEYDTSVEGFTDTMAYEERKRNVLRLLANMKMFLTTAKIKFIFISGHELYDASLADLSDREFAVSSIFNGVLNVDSFLSPEMEQNDVSFLTEQYVSNLLLPSNYLWDKMNKTVRENGYIKEEVASLRWYNQYLLETHILGKKSKDDIIKRRNKSDKEVKRREEEIRFVVSFLRYFTVYLAHISNGSPKKIAAYFEKYVKTYYDTVKPFDWDDVVTVGEPSEESSRKQCVLYFSPDDQRLINFVSYIAYPVMSAITNENSHYGDKLLVSTSFILDHVYKYHGNGFSWRNLEQLPELLSVNKVPELRDAMSSLIEFLLQNHITTIPSGVFHYKFHKQIAEEISYLSKTSEEAAAIFNFTLNETESVKRYNNKLLQHYMRLAEMTRYKEGKENKDLHRYDYHQTLERIHENLGDIYFAEEDYYRAAHEYMNALQYVGTVEDKNFNILTYLKCSLKMGLAYECRRTYEKAYLIYNEVVNTLVHRRWYEENTLGLDSIKILTHDWRRKQALLVNYKATQDLFGTKKESKPTILRDHYGRTHWIIQKNEDGDTGNPNSLYRRQYWTGLYDDENNKASNIQYSLTADQITTDLYSNYTPEKHDFIQQLSVFEDVRYIYQAILARLFVAEKMDSSGITLSAIEFAEADFITLHSAVNIDEKYVLSADFFRKMGEILFYKNGVVLNRPNTLRTALYIDDIDVLAYIDDYCFSKSNNGYTAIDAVSIKRDIIEFFDRLVIAGKSRTPKPRGINIVTDKKFNKFLEDEIQPVIQSIVSAGGENDADVVTRKVANINDYLEFLKQIDAFKDVEVYKSIEACNEKRGNNRRPMPCMACKYISRSLNILMENMLMFDEEEKNLNANRYIKSRYNYPSRVYALLVHGSKDSVRKRKINHLQLLAATSEEMAKVLLSCSRTKFERDDKTEQKHLTCLLTEKTLKILEIVAKGEGSAQSVKEKIKGVLEADKLTKEDSFNKAILYLWAAYRYYGIPGYHKEALHSLECILRLLEDQTMLIASSLSQTNQEGKIIEDRPIVIKLITNLINGVEELGEENRNEEDPEKFPLLYRIFLRAVQAVRKQYEGSGLAELNEFKWIFHLESFEQLDLIQLSTFTDLQSIYISIQNIKMHCYEILNLLEEGKATLLIPELRKQYTRINPTLFHVRSFKNKVNASHSKAYMNHIILTELLGGDIIARQRNQYNIDGKAEEKLFFNHEFYKRLNDFLISSNDFPLSKEIFGTEAFLATESRMQLVEFLIRDSIICLSEVLSVITPHNNITTCSDRFMAEVYDMLWEWSLYYRGVYELYLYGKLDKQNDNTMSEQLLKTMAQIAEVSPSKHQETIHAVRLSMRNCLQRISSISEKNKYGEPYSRLFANIRHDIDDATIHHIFTDFSAEMATRHYQRSSGNSKEGRAYQFLIQGMYVLDDDLHNDTCQINIAAERYLVNSDYIKRKRKSLEWMYENSHLNQLQSYENQYVFDVEDADNETNSISKYSQIKQRLNDSAYTNSQY